MARKRLAALAAQEFTQVDLLEELAARYGLPERQPGDVTAQELAARVGFSIKVARLRLAREVAAGRLVRVVVRGGRVVWRKKALSKG